MYFAIAYEMWPRITGKPLRSKRLARWQLWLWFFGMLVTTIPWHITGSDGTAAARRDIRLQRPAACTNGSAGHHVGHWRLHPADVRDPADRRSGSLAARRDGMLPAPLRYALAVNPPVHGPASLNGFALWNAIVLVLMVVAYGYPIGQFFVLKSFGSSLRSDAADSRRWERGDGARSRCIQARQPLAADRLDFGGAIVFVSSCSASSCSAGTSRMTRRSISGTRSAAGLASPPTAGPAAEPQPPLRTPTR